MNSNTAGGLSQREIFTKDVLRNAIIPIVNGIPGSIILTISGSVITETVLSECPILKGIYVQFHPKKLL